MPVLGAVYGPVGQGVAEGPAATAANRATDRPLLSESETPLGSQACWAGRAIRTQAALARGVLLPRRHVAATVMCCLVVAGVLLLPHKSTRTQRAPALRHSEGMISEAEAMKFCSDGLTVDGLDSGVLINAAYDIPGKTSGGIVEVSEGRVITAKVGARAYFGEKCDQNVFVNDEYTALNLLGKTIRYSVDLSGVGCGCNAAVYLTSMRQNPDKSLCGDYYCDAASVCGVSCAEIDLSEANQFSFRSTLHLESDHDGTAMGYGRGYSDWDSSSYAPGSDCIDTNQPFQVAVSFPLDEYANLTGVQVELSQEGRDCGLSASIEAYAFEKANGLAELTEIMRKGMTLIVSYWSSEDMLWLDGPACEITGNTSVGRRYQQIDPARNCSEEDPCNMDDPAQCAESVRFFDFSVEGPGEPTFTSITSATTWTSSSSTTSATGTGSSTTATQVSQTEVSSSSTEVTGTTHTSTTKLPTTTTSSSSKSEVGGDSEHDDVEDEETDKFLSQIGVHQAKASELAASVSIDAEQREESTTSLEQEWGPDEIWIRPVESEDSTTDDSTMTKPDTSTTSMTTVDDSASGAPLFEFYMYRAATAEDTDTPAGEVNTGNLEGVVWYLMNEVVTMYTEGTRCPRKTNISHLYRYKVRTRATKELHDLGMNFGARFAYDFGMCMGRCFSQNLCTSADDCREHYDRYGFNPGCNSFRDRYPFPDFDTPAPDGIWYSLPFGGRCEGKPTGESSCTWSVESAGAVSLEEIENTKPWGGNCCPADRCTGFWDNQFDEGATKSRVNDILDIFAEKFPDMPRDLDTAPCDFKREKWYADDAWPRRDPWAASDEQEAPDDQEGGGRQDDTTSAEDARDSHISERDGEMTRPAPEPKADNVLDALGISDGHPGQRAQNISEALPFLLSSNDQKRQEYDCEDGLESWKDTWVLAKALWCCKTAHVGCLDEFTFRK